MFVRADVEPAKDPWWSLYGGAEGHAGVGFPGLSYDAPLGSVEKLLASAPGGSPAASITNWARAYSGDSTDRLSTVVPIAGGGWLVGGTTLSFSSTPADAWLVATDAIGEPMWQRAYDDLDSVRALAATADGDYLVATGTTDPGVGGLLKVDANGAVSWSKSVTDAGSAGVKINDVVATPDGGALLGGTLGEYSAADYWVAKLDAQGKPVWSFSYGGGGEDDLHALVDTGDGGVLAVGTSESFTPLPLTWAVRLDADGKVLWQKSYDSGGDLYGEHAIVAPSGGFLVSGENVLDAMALRLDDSGNVSWATNIASSTQDASIDGAASLPGGGFAIAGSESSNAWIVALDSGGSVTWSHRYGGAGDEGIGGMQELHGIGEPLLSEPDGTLIAAGASSSFGSGDDGWLLETTPNGNVTFSGSSGAQETNPSGSYPPLALTTATTAVAAAVAPLTVSELTVRTSSTEASTISQAP